MRKAAAILSLVLVVVAAASAAAVPTDRSVKLDLIGKLKRGPEILVLGDSRGRQAQPSFVRRLTGYGAFNAAVTGGTAADAWVFTRYCSGVSRITRSSVGRLRSTLAIRFNCPASSVPTARSFKRGRRTVSVSR